MESKLLEIDGVRTDVVVNIAASWFSRLVGLLNRNSLSDVEGLALVPCASIHTLWMRFTIDAVFLDDSGKVLGVAEGIKPFRFCFAPKGTRVVLELASGNAKRTGINLEQVLKFV
ncbi:MAG: DUF192 domain-containing protein [Pseudomonadales bacterium]|nr:DUF192 domain-containing protein [Pseudomonadales bacterium]